MSYAARSNLIPLNSSGLDKHSVSSVSSLRAHPSLQRCCAVFLNAGCISPVNQSCFFLTTFLLFICLKRMCEERSFTLPAGDVKIFVFFEGGSDVCKQRCWSFSNQSVVWWSYRLMKASNVEKLNTNVRWNAHRMQYECSWAQLNRLWRLLLGSLFILFFCRWIKEKIFSVILYLYNFIFCCWEDVRQIICRFTISI